MVGGALHLDLYQRDNRIKGVIGNTARVSIKTVELPLGTREGTHMSQNAQRILSNPKFQDLVAKRSAFAWTLSIAMLAIYFGFILLVAFGKGFLGTPIGSGVTTWGIPIGVFTIVSAFILTGIYVQRANGEFDELNRQILEESK